MCPPHDNPFPTLDTSPSASQEALDAEIARATARENEIASGIAPAVTAAASGIEQSIRNDLSGVTSGIAATAATAMSNSQQAVTIASQARQVANAAESTAAARAATVASGIAASVATSTAESVVENSLDRIDYEYDRKLGQFARKEYVDACLKQAVVMTQSPDGLSQIQVTNSGVPVVKVSRPSMAIYVDENNVAHKFGWTPDSTPLIPSDNPNTLYIEDGFTRADFDSNNCYGLRYGIIMSGTPLYYGIVKNNKPTTSFMQGNVTFTNGTFESTSSRFGTSITIYENTASTYYLVTEETLGSLEARIAALEAAQS